MESCRFVFLKRFHFWEVEQVKKLDVKIKTNIRLEKIFLSKRIAADFV